MHALLLDAIVSATPLTAPAAKTVTAPPTSTFSLIAPMLVLAVLAVAAFLLKRRAAPTARGIRILESASLGPKRSVVVAEIGGERLVLGVSEAGIALLRVQAPAAVAEVPAPQAAAPITAQEPARATAFSTSPSLTSLSQAANLAKRIALAPFQGKDRVPVPSFEAALQESAEDLDLRRKLARGSSGRVSP